MLPLFFQLTLTVAVLHALKISNPINSPLQKTHVCYDNAIRRSRGRVVVNLATAIAKQIHASNAVQEIMVVDWAAEEWKIGIKSDHSCCIESITLCFVIFSRRVGCRKCDAL